MTGPTYSFKKHRRLPGQSELSTQQWEEFVLKEQSRELSEEYAQRDRERRKANVNIAENLKLLRLRLDLTQTQLAEALGISLRSLQMYERGERPLPSDVVAELYATFDIDLHQLFTGTVREPTRHWKEAFADLALQLADDVKQSFSRLEPEDQKALVKEYMALATPGAPIDNSDLLMCHRILFKPSPEDLEED